MSLRIHLSRVHGGGWLWVMRTPDRHRWQNRVSEQDGWEGLAVKYLMLIYGNEQVWNSVDADGFAKLVAVNPL